MRVSSPHGHRNGSWRSPLVYLRRQVTVALIEKRLIENNLLAGFDAFGKGFIANRRGFICVSGDAMGKDEG